MTTITTGDTTITPDLVLGYTAARAARSIAHDVLGRIDPDVTLKASATRKGSLALFFSDEGAAWAAYDAHAAAALFAIADGDVSEVSMTYAVTDGDLTIDLDTDYNRWTVTVPYREVIT